MQPAPRSGTPGFSSGPGVVPGRIWGPVRGARIESVRPCGIHGVTEAGFSCPTAAFRLHVKGGWLLGRAGQGWCGISPSHHVVIGAGAFRYQTWERILEFADRMSWTAKVWRGVQCDPGTLSCTYIPYSVLAMSVCPHPERYTALYIVGPFTVT